jgi:glycosyltransferase involved in cell wall biosynthesis
MSTVSVIVPCYNYAHFLRECVESVVSQAGVDVSVLIIDDESSDNTPEVAVELASRYPCVEYRRHEKNMGNIATFNEGLAWASGDYTLLISADDLLTPDSLMRASHILDEHSEVGFVYGGCLDFNTDQPLPQPRLPSPSCTWEIYKGIDWLEHLCKTGWPGMWSPEVLVRTSLQHKLGEFNPKLPYEADVEMWMRFAVNASIARITDADQAFHREHAQNMHIRQYLKLHKTIYERKASFDSIFQDYKDLIPDWERLQKMAYRSLARDAFWAIGQAYYRKQVAQTPVKELFKFATRGYGGKLFDLDHLQVYSWAIGRYFRTLLHKLGLI